MEHAAIAASATGPAQKKKLEANGKMVDFKQLLGIDPDRGTTNSA
ncbi:hypothetical protein [Bradyrhizobium sp. NC92]|nr:hypothetical protein [Bradyrhizobium sp. NC92]UWU67857.1 hypothetical protein N2602_32390 [Bradyrhizobium sp. NC92]